MRKKKNLNDISTFRYEANYFFNNLIVKRIFKSRIEATKWFSEALKKEFDVSKLTKEDCNLTIHYCHLLNKRT